MTTVTTAQRTSTIADPIDPDRLTDPDLHTAGLAHEVWRDLREREPVRRHPGGAFPSFWSLTRHADIRAVYRDPQTFSSASGVLLRPLDRDQDPGGGLTMALTDPPRHKQFRSLMADWFSARGVRALQSPLTADCRELVAHAVAAGEVDFAHDVAARLSLWTIGGIVGIPAADLDDVHRWTDEAFSAGRSLAAHHELMEYVLKLMYARMAEPADDLLSTLVNGMVDDELLTEQEIVLNLENLIGATENGRLALIGGLLALIEHPGEWERLLADRSLVPSAVEEILRWTSSAVHSMRTVTRDVEIRGRHIAAGDKVVLWLPSADRDEDVFADPERFDVGRRPNRHLALGAGEHFCLGSVLARAQIGTLLSELLDVVADVEVAGPVVPAHSIAVSGPEHLPVRFRRP